MIYSQIREELLDFFHLRKKPCKYCGKLTSCSCGCCHSFECNEKYYAEQNKLLQENIMITKEQQIKLWKEFKKFKTDEERWKFIIDNQFKGIRINLDNDDTFGIFEWDDNGDYIFQFDNYIGRSDGVMVLLSIIGIDADCI